LLVDKEMLALFSDGGFVFEAHRLVYHSTLGSRIIQKKRRKLSRGPGIHCVERICLPKTIFKSLKNVENKFGSKTSLGGVLLEQKMLKGHLPRVIYHQAYAGK